ncbi:MAG: hypothetical protein IKU07_10560 [Oscillospiraceae bacterium]|nr:hypothetical protein [Oscillospiraceae bacterium]
MKRIISLLLVTVLILGLCACGESGGGKKGLQVGFDRQSILPTQLGVQIAGGDAAARLSEGFLDEVSTTCIAFSKDDQTYLVYTCDFMVVYASIVDPVKAAICAKTGVPTENILFNCTHTHSGVNILSTGWEGGAQYRELFSKQCVKAAEKAIADMAPATISYGSTQTEGMTFVRHYNLTDGTTYGNGHGSWNGDPELLKEHMYKADEELQLIKFTREAEDKKDIVIASFPSHATTVNSTNMKDLSACYPGAFRAAMEETGVHCAFFQGASGDQVPTSKIQSLNAVWPQNHKLYGQKLAEYAQSIELTPMDDSKLVFSRWEYRGNSMKEGTEDVQRLVQAKELVALSSQMGGYSHPNVTAKVNEYGFSSWLEADGLVKRANYEETLKMYMVAMQLGSEVSMVFAPYEMFGMHGTYIKENSPFAMDFIVTCSEDYQGYFPHVQGCEENFYEYDVTHYERGTGEKLAEIFATKLTEMKNAG